MSAAAQTGQQSFDAEQGTRSAARDGQAALPEMGTAWILVVGAITTIDALDVIFDYMFAAGLIFRGGGENVAFGFWFVICTTWATFLAILSKSYLSGKTRNKPQDAEDMNGVVLNTESTIFLIEDCTLVMVIASVDDAYDATDMGNILTVALSLASAVITILTYLRLARHDITNENCSFAIIWIAAITPSCYFAYLMIRLLINGGLSDDLGSRELIFAWVLYVLQVIWAIIMSWGLLDGVGIFLNECCRNFCSILCGCTG